jgi:hypothetical protein
MHLVSNVEPQLRVLSNSHVGRQRRRIHIACAAHSIYSLGVECRFGIHLAIRIKLWTSPCANIRGALVLLPMIEVGPNPCSPWTPDSQWTVLQSEGAV